jgi:hypothetical protein
MLLLLQLPLELLLLHVLPLLMLLAPLQAPTCPRSQ